MIPLSIMNIEPRLPNGSSKIHLGKCNTHIFISVIQNRYETFFGTPFSLTPFLTLESNEYQLYFLKGGTALCDQWRRIR